MRVTLGLFCVLLLLTPGISCKERDDDDILSRSVDEEVDSFAQSFDEELDKLLTEDELDDRIPNDDDDDYPLEDTKNSKEEQPSQQDAGMETTIVNETPKTQDEDDSDIFSKCVPQDLNLPSEDHARLDDGPYKIPNDDPGAIEAAEYVRFRVNQALDKCDFGNKFVSQTISQCISQPGMDTAYFMELVMQDSDNGQRVFHVAVQHIIDFDQTEVLDKKTGKETKLKFRIRSIQPNPCDDSALAQTFLSVRAHNSRSDKAYEAAVYPRFFGKTTQQIADLYLGSTDSDPSSVDPALLLQVDVTTLDNYKRVGKYRVQAGRYSEVWDQGSCASCYALAAATVIAGRIYVANNYTMDIKLSADEIQDCTRQCNGGSAQDVFSRLQSNPVAEEWCLPDRKKFELHPTRVRQSVIPGGGYCGSRCFESKNDSYSAKWGAQDFKVLDTTTLTPDQRVAAIEQQIMEGGPVYVSINVTEDFMQYKEGVFRPNVSATYIGAHAVALVGWSNNITHYRRLCDPKTQMGVPKPYWIVQNSWGASWGENGTARILKGSNTMGIETLGIWIPTVLSKPQNLVANCSDWNSCLNGGSMDSTCKCRCPYPREGDRCENCPLSADCGMGQLDNSMRSCVCDCNLGVEKDGDGKCTQIKAKLSGNTWYPGGPNINISWNTPSSIGSYCNFTASANNTFRVYLCGNPSQWNEDKSRCDARGNVQIDSDVLATLPTAFYSMKCWEFAGKNEFNRSRGDSPMFGGRIIDTLHVMPLSVEDILDKGLKEKSANSNPENRYYIDKNGNLFYTGEMANLYLVGKGRNYVVSDDKKNRIFLNKDGNLQNVDKSGEAALLGPNAILSAYDEVGESQPITEISDRIFCDVIQAKTKVPLKAIGKDGHLYSVETSMLLNTRGKDTDKTGPVVVENFNVMLTPNGTLAIPGKIITATAFQPPPNWSTDNACNEERKSTKETEDGRPNKKINDGRPNKKINDGRPNKKINDGRPNKKINDGKSVSNGNDN